MRKHFFSMFYFAIHAGSLISTLMIPVFRTDVRCYPYETDPIFDECYALAFGISALLMLISLSMSTYTVVLVAIEHFMQDYVNNFVKSCISLFSFLLHMRLFQGYSQLQQT